MTLRIPFHLAALLALAVTMLQSISARATVFHGISNPSTLDTRTTPYISPAITGPEIVVEQLARASHRWPASSTLPSIQLNQPPIATTP